jgi:hypothetical protein
MNPRELKIKPPRAIHAPKTLKFLQRVRVKETLSETIVLEGAEHTKFYAGATGRIIRFNIEDGTLVVLLDTNPEVKESGVIMEVFTEADLEPLEA